MMSDISTMTDPVVMAMTYIRDTSEILQSNEGFRGWVIVWYQSWHHSKTPERTV